MMHSVRVMTSSSNMLLHHVEDILGYAQLKAGKFIKNIENFNIQKTVEDIILIQKY
jgi:signal transduction histidine kinase